MKKRWLIALAVFLVSVNAFGAGGGERASGAIEKQKVIVSVWDDPNESGINAISEEFMRLNPGVEVEVQVTPFARYEDKMRTTLAGNDVPDFMQINDDYVPLYADRGLLLSLNDQVEKLKLDVDKYYTPVWQAGWVGDQLVTFVPSSKVRLIIYNRDAFKAAGVPEPPTQWNDPSWNWDTFLDYAQKLTKRQGNVTTQWGIVGLTGTTAEALWPGNITGTGLFGADGKTAAVCSPEARPGVQYLVDTLLKYKVHPLFGETAQAQNLFISGQAAMIIDGSQAFATFRSSCTFDWDVAPVPMRKYGKTLPGLMVYGVPKKTKNPDLAAKFLFFLGEEFAQQKFAEGGNIPINKDYAARFYPRPGVKPSKQQTVLDGANWFIVNNLNPKTDEARRAYRQYLHQAYAGEVSVDDAMAKAKIDIEAIFGRP